MAVTTKRVGATGIWWVEIRMALTPYRVLSSPPMATVPGWKALRVNKSP